MTTHRIRRLTVRNFRSLAELSVETNDLTVLFGPNGAGKTTFLDTIWFVRDCAIRGVDTASSERDHGIGVLWDGADNGDLISIKIETDSAAYEISLGLSAGRIESYVGEELVSEDGRVLIKRSVGSNKATFYHNKFKQNMDVELREPEKLALTRYLDLEEDTPPEAMEVDSALRYVHFYKGRSLNLYQLVKKGSESSYQTKVWPSGQNLWSVLRNLHDRRGLDERYDVIVDFMRESFPGQFRDLLIEQTGPNVVVGSFVEEGRQQPIQASGVSDGHLHMLIHLAALFSEGKDRGAIILFDEPEISLHPHALAILAKAIKTATQDWGKQVFVATHSPVLVSQFDVENIFAASIGSHGETILRRVDEIPDIKDLLEEYALGSLYMAQAIAPQGNMDRDVEGVTA